MAKNKLRGQKSRNVFHIASQKNFKSKNKAKPVTTNLKKINIVNNEKVTRVNKAFVDIQKELAHFSKGLSLEPLQKQLCFFPFRFLSSVMKTNQLMLMKRQD
ncbi:ribosomal biogenesis factor isoform X1 [Mustela nigripes]|uniref:Ribosomal biogenesis factor n=1 Tax=Mustela putorius furo TaxID=9669 RepID=M3YH74_MUSPF|nr:ribosomal biogenesis factor isoform X1 [Mustela putorius furo]XP_032172252.1 ribosomal biogenesis factor isoform X1 [Mustela erminea]XP_059022085.1 ribosomal biogenesis factor isoform X1 [Mustela lutreola]XP_059250791.1 ribosomal biogenesis factor isoform X1 [Mustela nigripes]